MHEIYIIFQFNLHRYAIVTVLFLCYDLGTYEDKVTPVQLTTEYREAIDIFPALHKYKTEHNTDNLKKLCVEIADFCRAIYASTQNEDERQIYRNMVENLKR